MDKLILIDGNSLLNRAFYAIAPFSTKDGMPTNGIFGFLKLVFKIISEEHPTHFAVTFDVHAPTFRHKLYSEYKGTRKPMPEELVRQVPVLKELLRAMRICTVELAGYEADDLLGTLSKRFGDVKVLIYTGDRDAYQLVEGNVSVCFTKKGVSEVERFDERNFVEKLGVTPRQIVQLKALQGDSSDNIPGVHGIGPKRALSLIQTYGDLDGVYAHLDEIGGGARERLEEGRESAELSRRLAAIDRDVPLALTLDECKLVLPFPEEARKLCAQLEFRSLVDSEFFPSERTDNVPVVVCEDPNQLLSALEGVREFAFTVEKEGVHVSFGSCEYLFPLRENFLMPGFFLEELKPMLCELFAGRRALLADVKSTAHLFDEMGLTLQGEVEDVTLLRYLQDSNQRPSSAKELAKDYALTEDRCAYALFRAYHEASEKMKGSAEESIYRDLELPLTYVLFDMERTGVCVDTGMFPYFSERFNAELGALSEQVFELAGEKFNLNSPFQLSEVLFDRLGYSPNGAKKNVRGGYSTSAEVLERLAEEHEIARLILRYRELQKLQSTYIDGIRPLVTGGVVHTTYNQTMTTTGRLSSANPNLQNIPVRTDEGRELRKLFVAREGHVLIDADYSQIELRLLAHFSACKALLEAYRTGEDVHASTAARVFGVPLDRVTGTMRRRAKTINFGIIYGMSAFGLAKDLGCPTQEAQDYIDKYFGTHPEVKAYMDENVRFAKEEGYVKTVLGRKRYIAELRSPNYNIRMFGERAAMNMPLQGSAADIIKIAMLHVSERLKREGLAAKMVLQVHDELVLDAPEAEAERAAALLKEEMEGAIELAVPLIAEVSTGKSWYDAK